MSPGRQLLTPSGHPRCRPKRRLCDLTDRSHARILTPAQTFPVPWLRGPPVSVKTALYTAAIALVVVVGYEHRKNGGAVPLMGRAQ